MRTLTRWCVAWAVLCTALGAAAAWQVSQLSSSADALGDTGQALERTGETLHELSSLPLIGSDAERAADAVQDGGERAQRAADDAHSTIDRTAIMVGFALALLPTIPLFVVRRALRDVAGPPR